MEKLYIRFGYVPKNEISNQYNDSGDIIKQESGVSVYDTICIDGIMRIIMPKKPTATTAVTLYQMYDRFCGKQKCDDPILLVTGDEVGYGSDNEPLLKNVKVLHELNTDFTIKTNE